MHFTFSFEVRMAEGSSIFRNKGIFPTVERKYEFFCFFVFFFLQHISMTREMKESEVFDVQSRGVKDMQYLITK